MSMGNSEGWTPESVTWMMQVMLQASKQLINGCEVVRVIIFRKRLKKAAAAG